VFKGNSLDTFTKKPWKASKKPWYFLTKEESITINNRHRPVKRTHDDLIIDYLNHKLNKWKKTHPDVDESDLFYKEQHPEWVQKYEEAHDAIVAQLSKKYIKKYTDTLASYILKSRNKYSSILPETKSAA
jgi:hypothetical protein